MGKVKVSTVEQQILAHLNDNGQKLSWLAEKTGVSVGHLHSVLKGRSGVKRTLTEENKAKINQALNTNY
jgi:lambda repressor-like predicted transcriptional regulator